MNDAESLVKAVLNGDLDFDGALEELLNDELTLEEAHAALVYFSRGQLKKRIKGKATVAQIIAEHGLEPFVSLLNEQVPDSHGEVQHPVGTLVEFGGETFRVIGRRQVTILAMPREDAFEIFLETLDGKPKYFVGESMVQPVEDEEE